MPRKGRVTEKIVALLEKGLLPGGAEVKSPCYLPDKITGELREVDVAIRYKLGAIPILIIVECRDRKVKADVPWIEQVAQKQADLNAAKAIAVSTSGFTASARQKAAHHGIEIREISKLTLADVADWFVAGDSFLFLRRNEVKRVSVILDGRTAWEELKIDPGTEQKLRNLKLDVALFEVKKTGESVSTMVPWSHALNIPGVYDGVPQDGSRVERIIELQYPDPSERYVFRVPEEVIYIECLRFYAELWIEVSRVPISQVLAYASPEEELIRGVQYEVSAGANQFIVTLQRRVETGETSMAVSRLKPERLKGGSRNANLGD